MKARHFRVGSTSSCGRRPVKYRASKDELERIIRACYERGIGSHIISRMIGYSHTIISQYATDFGLAKVDNTKRAEWLMGFLPSEIQSDIRRVKTNSDIAHQRAANRDAKAPSRRLHHLLDDELQTCDKSGGAVRPEKAAA